MKSASSWDGLIAKVSNPRIVKKTRPVNPIIAQLIKHDPTRTELFHSPEFRTALESLLTLQTGEMRQRLLRLLNILTGYIQPLAEVEFLRQRNGPFSKRAEEASNLIMKAADVLGHRGKFLPGVAHKSLYTADGIIELESANELGAALFTVAKVLEAAGEAVGKIPEADKPIMAGMGLDAGNIAKRGVRKSKPETAVAGFLARELDECLKSVPEMERWMLASKLLIYAGHEIDTKTLRALAKKGH